MKCDVDYYRNVVKDLDQDCKDIVEYLYENTCFFDSPASTKYHHVYKGGLAIHCIEIYNILVNSVKENNLPYDNSTLFLIAVGHDLDKLNRYVWDDSHRCFSYRNLRMDGMFHGSRGFNLLNKYLNGKIMERPDRNKIEVSICGHMGTYGRWNVEKQYWEDHKGFDLLQLTFDADMKSCELNGKDFEIEEP